MKYGGSIDMDTSKHQGDDGEEHSLRFDFILFYLSLMNQNNLSAFG